MLFRSRKGEFGRWLGETTPVWLKHFGMTEEEWQKEGKALYWAIGGWYDIVVAMYHDQGHIPLKVKGFVYNKELKKWDAVAGVNVTLGIPVIRVSVDHGTGFDLAGKGESNELSLVNSIDYATKLAVNKK